MTDVSSLTIGFGELISGIVVLAGIGYGLMKALFLKHVEPIKDVIHDVKKLELEHIRTEAKVAITYATKEDLMRAQERHDRVIERVFGLLQTINDKLDKKIDRDEAEKLTLRQEMRQ